MNEMNGEPSRIAAPAEHPATMLTAIELAMHVSAESQPAARSVILGATTQVLSPLRYPGSKRRQARYIASVLLANGDTPDHLVEPFAGGASVSLYLLKHKVVAEALLGEKDPFVAAFWRVVKNHPEALANRIDSTRPTLTEWKRQRKAQPTSDLGKAFKCLFLNRTSFGGILARRTGPIGGAQQKSIYDVACRYAADATKTRIRECSELLENAAIVEGTYRQTMAWAKRRWNTAVVAYLDPPFYHKADRLYSHFFQESDHDKLHAWLKGYGAPWILSYDAATEVERLYSDFADKTRRMHIRYTSAGHGARERAHELVITNLPVVPRATEFVEYRPKTKRITQ